MTRKPSSRPPQAAAGDLPTRVAIPDDETGGGPVPMHESRVSEPVWLVRIVIVLFLVGFAAFLAREVANFLRTL